MEKQHADIVFHHAPWSRAASIRWLLEELGVNYRLRVINFHDPKGVPEDYRRIQPHKKVPAIEHGDVSVTERAAITIYLADAFPRAGLAPAVDWVQTLPDGELDEPVRSSTRTPMGSEPTAPFGPFSLRSGRGNRSWSLGAACARIIDSSAPTASKNFVSRSNRTAARGSSSERNGLRIGSENERQGGTKGSLRSTCERPRWDEILLDAITQGPITQGAITQGLRG